MNLIILIINFFLSMIFIKMKHPLSMGLILLLQTITVSLICGLISFTYWFSYILFLVMIGGMLVLFIYMTSLASNELFNFSMNYLMITITLIFMTIMMSYFIDNHFMFMINQDSNYYHMITENFENQLNLIKLYNNPTMNLTIMLINYLFLTLIIVVYITKKNFGPLRSTN
uniref:NADH-ubiquinone oxidoreductase chain 6 n=1 Tax=Gryposmylus pennyi TaxID=1935900 RepID=A0A7H0TJI1_9NEOP|nr:NADH dehydrogenase subunit 6 [Gryposmylus pennyi]QNR01170.1 NADH dehydrogenase subunit 6 [Gryposmylus pennyi]